MRYIIFSDSHGSKANMREAIMRNLRIGSGLDGMVFLGDGVKSAREVADEFSLELFAVRGNNDITLEYPHERVVTLGTVKVMLMHGHRMSAASADRYAMQEGAAILMCGHTHRKSDLRLPAGEGYSELRIFNPGSISLPRDGSASFGMMEIRNGCVMLSHGEI